MYKIHTKPAVYIEKCKYMIITAKNKHKQDKCLQFIHVKPL